MFEKSHSVMCRGGGRDAGLFPLGVRETTEVAGASTTAPCGCKTTAMVVASRVLERTEERRQY
jgi:hypothetical protein